MIEYLRFEEWMAFDAAHPAPTFFARPPWALALADAHASMQPAPVRMTLEAGERIIVPMMQMAGGAIRWREYCAFPMGGYTCFLREDGSLATPLQCDEALLLLRRSADSVRIVPWPLGSGPSVGKRTAHETAVVDLGGGIDNALAGVAGIFRRMAGQAERRGVVCAPSRDHGAVDEYYRLLQASAKRWGIERPSISKAMLHALVRRGGDDVEIWFARAQERNIGGGVVFYGSQEFFFWSAAMDAEYGRLRPSNALNFALLRAASARGMQYYNLGSSEGLPGVAKFKDNLGAREIAYHDLTLVRAPYKVYSSVRRALATHAGI
ncbi:MAG: GNAT family N-acetyltransferase [Candidatus Baltobacteraceae bacterium]